MRFYEDEVGDENRDYITEDCATCLYNGIMTDTINFTTRNPSWKTFYYASDLIRKGNSWYVRVRRGKGGKEQLQFILPKDVETVRQICEGVGPEDNVFSKEEMSNKINLHGLRAEHSKDCYGYYTGLLERRPEYADKLRATLLRRWDDGHEKLKEADPRAWKAQRERFVRDMDDRPYKLRGENLRKAQALGLPQEYNRLALMCVSVLHLSHWRLDVTTTNYLIT